jgi:hypothetical protein
MTARRRDELIEAPDEVLLRQVEMEFTRTRGPGGQHRNKVESGVRLSHRDSGLVVTATERRSQHENRRQALQRFRQTLAVEVRAEATQREAWPRSAAALIGSKNWPNLSPKTPGYWTLAARVLDRLSADGARLSDSAARLGVSTASLSKFLSGNADLWQATLRLRQKAGLPPLRP